MSAWKRVVWALCGLATTAAACKGAVESNESIDSADQALTAVIGPITLGDDINPTDYGDPVICDSALCDMGCDQAGDAIGVAQYGLCESTGCVCHAFLGGGGTGSGTGGKRCRGTADCNIGQICDLTTGRCVSNSFPSACESTEQCSHGKICVVNSPFDIVGRCCDPFMDLTCTIIDCAEPEDAGIDDDRVVYCSQQKR